MMIRRSLLVLTLFLAAAPPLALRAQGTRSCLEAAQGLVEAQLQLVREPRASSQSSSGSRTEAWSSAVGHEGICRFDRAGRLFAVEITRFPSAGSGGSGAPYTITCESTNGRRRECPLRSAGASVRLVRENGRRACTEGETYGVFGSTLWVDRGCRGVFSVESSWQPFTITCASDRYRRKECPTRQGAAARLLRQSSRAPCDEGRTWGHGDGALWVDSGCAGSFEIFPGDSSPMERARDACRRHIVGQGLQIREELSVREIRRDVEITYRTGIGQVSSTTVCTFDTVAGTARTRGR